MFVSQFQLACVSGASSTTESYILTLFHCNISWHVLSRVSSYLATRKRLAVTPSKCFMRSKGGPGLVVAYHFRIYSLKGGCYELLHAHSSAHSQEQDVISVASPGCELCRFRFVCASYN